MTIIISDQMGHPAEEITQALSAAGTVYAGLYPDRVVTVMMHAASGDRWGQPVVFDPQTPVLGQITLEPIQGPAQDAITVRVALPTPAPARDETEPPWFPPRVLAPVFHRSPLAYETIRYQVELWRKWRARGAILPDSQPPADAGIMAPAKDQRPAILIGMHWLEIGGAEKMGFATVEWALAAGLRVFVVAGTPGAQSLASRLPDHPDVTFLRPDLYLRAEDWPRYLANLMAAQNIQLVHNHHCHPIYAALPYLAHVVPWVRHIDTTHIVENVNGGYPEISGQRSGYIHMHHVISKALQRFLRDAHKVPGEVTLGRMLFAETATPVALPQMTMTAGQTALHVVFIGRLNYQKRPIVVVEALRRIALWAAKNGVALRATLMGEGPFLGAVTDLLARYDLTNLVTLAPADTHAPTLLKGADILLLPSNNEGLALVCYEAIEQGCIPLTTDVGAQAEIIPPDLLLPVAPRACLHAMVRVLDRLWRDPDFLAGQQTALHDRYQAIKADPTAHDVLMPLYQAVADGRDIFEG